MKKILFLIFQFTIFTASSFSQVNQEWAQRYNGPGNDYDGAYSITVDGSGNIYVTGVSAGSGTGQDIATIKYNSSGVQQWVQRYNGPGNFTDAATSITVDGSGNVYVTGYSYGSGTNFDYVTIKYNTNGVQQWVQRYNGPGNYDDQARYISVDNSGNVYVTGWSFGSGMDYDYATIKYNSNGVQQWVQRYNGPGNSDDKALSIAIDISGYIYVTGYSWGSGTDDDYATIKYNTNGVQLWVQRYNGPGNGNDVATSMAIDGSDNIYVTGYSWGGSTSYDYTTIKYNASGAQEWVQRYDGSGSLSEYASSIAIDSLGNVYITGYSWGNETELDYATIKYNTNGVQQWVQRYNGPVNDDEALYVVVDGSGNAYVTGYSKRIETGYDYATIKYNSNGVQEWVERYNGPSNGDDKAHSIAVDGSGNVYVTGCSAGSGTYFDYATVKYSQNIGIKPISTNIPDKFALQQNYPNPFNPTTKIKFEIPLNKGGERGLSFVSLTVYDILGREVTTLVNEQLQPGTYEVDFDGSNYPSGVYFYKLIVIDASTSLSTSYSESKKMLMIK